MNQSHSSKPSPPGRLSDEQVHERLTRLEIILTELERRMDYFEEAVDEMRGGVTGLRELLEHWQAHDDAHTERDPRQERPPHY